MIRPLAPRIVLLATLALLSTVPTSGQEGTGETASIELNPDARTQVRLAFPAVDVAPGLSAGELQAAREIEQTLRADLDEMDLFNVMSPVEMSVLSLTGVAEQDFEQYRSLGNEVVLLATVRPEEGKMVLEGRVYDLASQQSILGKRYRGEPEQARRIAHTLADAIHRQFSGRPSLALTTIGFHSDRSGYQELWLMDYDGRNQRQISAHQSTSGYVDWSPSGDALAYLSYFNVSPGIYYVDIATNQKRTVWTDGTLSTSPTFSPDGTKIAFAHSVGTNIDIFVCERECTQPRRITDSRAIDTNPSWSPDGNRIAFTSDRSGRPNIYLMNVDGSGVQRVSFEGDYNDGASWHPKGDFLTYASRHSYRFKVALTNLLDLTTRLLTSGSDSHEEPTFSPDGRKIAFTLKKARDSNIFSMDTAGANWRQLTHEGNNGAPDWSGFAE